LIHEVGSLRLVTIAEKPSFEEIIRARDLTKRYVNLDAVHINLLIPEDSTKKCKFCKNIRGLQQKYLKNILTEFKQLKIWESRRLDIEPIGLDNLRKLAEEIYGDATSQEILYP
ncbi:MAG: ArsA-related P-loop ATPase, partial [Promethearchaeota archaeon]